MKLWMYGALPLLLVGVGCQHLGYTEQKLPCVISSALKPHNGPEYTYSSTFAVRLPAEHQYVVTAETGDNDVFWVSTPLKVVDGKSEFSINVKEQLPLRISMMNEKAEILSEFTGTSEMFTQEGYYGAGEIMGEGGWLTTRIASIKFVGKSKDGDNIVINENSPDLFNIQFFIRELDESGKPIPIAFPIQK